LVNQKIMSRYCLLYPHDVPNSIWLMHHRGPTGKLEVRPEYQQLCCPVCKKIEERKALSLGLPNDVHIKLKTDLFSSNESLYIVSARLRSLLERIEPVEMSFFPFPDDERYYAALPNVVYPAVQGDPAFRMFRQCAQCGRWREVVWGTMPPPMDRECQIGMFQLEKPLGIMSIWVVTDCVASSLKNYRPRLKGLFFDEFFAPRLFSPETPVGPNKGGPNKGPNKGHKGDIL